MKTFTIKIMGKMLCFLRPHVWRTQNKNLQTQLAPKLDIEREKTVWSPVRLVVAESGGVLIH